METNSNKQTPPLYGLILAGGKSTRMGQDKHLLDYHGEPQAEYLYGMLQGLCEKTFMSIRADQKSYQNKGYEEIVDQNIFRGPFNGLLSAHARYPEAAWLVLACDLPLIDKQSIDRLIRDREPQKDATAMATRKTGLPEPLVAIWEPTGLETAKTYLKTAESSCPRKFLLRHACKLVFPEQDLVLLNANNPEEFQEALSIIRSN
ncbi:MAG: NTP transferase domain-containing protein [Eudoraea sp.]|nr:NTP transferase domain-containing protein [Eudoraea sp.]MBT8321919.1 NTP transferase domain-containing protein [Eudoraea sp.]NNJ38784.1 NTP transferase domain-containing protein [Flavobacteriaceae bacterium]